MVLLVFETIITVQEHYNIYTILFNVLIIKYMHILIFKIKIHSNRIFC